MAQEINNTRRCGQIGDGEDDELSMVDVLNEQARLQADANAVLGGSDEHNCTYPHDPVKRQALYACVTCTPEGTAGICLACSYACHEGHELHELYTKRFFRCDCGNDKFSGKECKLYKGKKEMNSRNRYSQNFKGLYCTCSRPYPDPDDPVEDEMIQCIMCEDWYHGRHLGISVPESDNYQEMICPGCMTRFPFLWSYNVTSEGTSVKNGNTSVDEDSAVDIIGCNGKVEAEASLVTVKNEESVGGNAGEPLSVSKKENNALDEGEEGHVNKDLDSIFGAVNGKRERQDDAQETLSSKKVKLENGESKSKLDLEGEVQEEGEECILKSLQKRTLEHCDKAAFWPDGWRTKLCRCPQCMEMYNDQNIEFLLDESDTVQTYEEKGRDSASNVSDEESEASALAGMNRVQQIEVVRGYMDLKTELNEFLQGFVAQGKVVTETDIREFFQRMEERKKERQHIPQYSCH